IHALQTRETTSFRQCLLLADVLQSIPGAQTAVQRPLGPQQTGEPAGVDIGNGHNIVALQEIVEILFITPVAGHQREVPNDQPSRPDRIGLVVLGVSTGIADVRIGQRDDLSRVGRISENFLIPGHGCVENHRSTGNTLRSDGAASEYTAIFQCQYCSITQCYLLLGGPNTGEKKRNETCASFRSCEFRTVLRCKHTEAALYAQGLSSVYWRELLK